MYRLMRSAIGIATIAIVPLVASSPVHGQRITGHLPNPNLETVFPAGLHAGGTTTVTVTGRDLQDLQELRFSHPGISAVSATDDAEKPVPGQFVVRVDETVPAGIYEARVLGKYGLSTPRAFAVGFLPEDREQEPNDAFAEAEPLALETTVNGQLAQRGDIDRFAVTLPPQQRVLFRCVAASLDSQMEPVMRLRNDAGEIVAVDLDLTHRNGLLDFTAAEGGRFVIEVHDLIHEGGATYPYRLTISTAPYIDYVFPLMGPRGRTAEFTLFGRNLPEGNPLPETLMNGHPLEQVAVEIGLPESPASLSASGSVEARGRQRIGYHVTAPRDLTEMVTFSLPGDIPALNRLHVGLTAASATPTSADAKTKAAAGGIPVIEAAENETTETAQRLQLPAEVAGRFYPLGDRDWFQFEAKQGEPLEIEVISQRMGQATDPFLLVQRLQEDGTAEDVAQIDDQTLLGYDQNRGGFENVGRFAFNSRTDDPGYRLVPPADGTYRVMLRERNHTTLSSPDFVYRLVIRPERPDVRLVATAHTPVDLGPNFRDFYPWTPVVRRGGSERIDVQVFRWGGFQGPVRVMVEDLPAGVACQPVVIAAGQTFAPLVFRAEPDAPLAAGPLQIVAEAEIEGETIRREATPATVLWKGITLREGPQSRQMGTMPLSVIDAPSPLLVSLPGQPFQTKRGETLEIPVTLQRGSYDGAVQITNIGLPKRFVTGGPVTIPKGQSTGTVKLTVAGKAPQTTVTFCLDAKLDLPDPRAADPAKAKKQAILISSTPLTVDVAE